MTTYAIDPGPHTGLVWRLDDGGFRARTLDISAADRPHKSLWNWLHINVRQGDTVILESFEFRKNERQREYINYKAGEYVGVVQVYCQLYKICVIVQNAATGKGFWDDDKLKRIGLYQLCDSKHTRDAMRHWLKHYTFTMGCDEYIMLLR